MTADPPAAGRLGATRDLVRRLLAGGIPRGPDFDSCRALLGSQRDGESAYTALCVLLEGALADPRLDIDDTQVLVALIKDLARGAVTTGELL